MANQSNPELIPVPDGSPLDWSPAESNHIVQQRKLQDVSLISIKSSEQSAVEDKTEHFDIHTTGSPIHDENHEQEDDEMLDMQLQLGLLQERNLKRKIEVMRRKANSGCETSSDRGFDLSRELSREIERARSAKSTSLIDKNRELEQQVELWKTEATKIRDQAIEETRKQAILEFNQF